MNYTKAARLPVELQGLGPSGEIDGVRVGPFGGKHRLPRGKPRPPAATAKPRRVRAAVVVQFGERSLAEWAAGATVDANQAAHRTCAVACSLRSQRATYRSVCRERIIRGGGVPPGTGAAAAEGRTRGDPITEGDRRSDEQRLMGRLIRESGLVRDARGAPAARLRRPCGFLFVRLSISTGKAQLGASAIGKSSMASARWQFR